MSGFIFNEKPIAIESGEGSYPYSDDGIEYLDFGASYAVTALGRSHPAVTSTIREQTAKLAYMQVSCPVKVRTELYEKLTTLVPGNISNVWLCNSGTEANEAATKFARFVIGRQKIVVTKRAFHGRALGSLALTWEQKYKKPYEPAAGDVEFVSYGGEAGLIEAADDEAAAMSLEPIQGEGDINPATAGCLQTTRDLADGAGVVLVFDEIQIGIGRTGTLWTCESAGVVPDILTNTKGVANGLPLSATLCASWVADGVASHDSTFPGGPVVCAATDATLDTTVGEDLPGHAAAVGDYLTTELEAAVEEHDLPIREVRGDGLMVGVEVRHGVNRILKHLALSKQLLTLPTGRTVVRFLPPFVIEEGHADHTVGIVMSV